MAPFSCHNISVPGHISIKSGHNFSKWTVWKKTVPDGQLPIVTEEISFRLSKTKSLCSVVRVGSSRVASFEKKKPKILLFQIWYSDDLYNKPVPSERLPYFYELFAIISNLWRQFIFVFTNFCSFFQILCENELLCKFL